MIKRVHAILNSNISQNMIKHNTGTDSEVKLKTRTGLTIIKLLSIQEKSQLKYLSLRKGELRIFLPLRTISDLSLYKMRIILALPFSDSDI
jgi:hypothetical protein